MAKLLRLLFLVILGFYCNDLESSLSQDVVDTLHTAKIRFQQRWHDFGGETRAFSPWTADWKEEELQDRWQQIVDERWSVYLADPEDISRRNICGKWQEAYRTVENQKSWHSRFPSSIAPAYNLAVPDYNANIVHFNGLCFIAMEGPSEKNVDAFFRLIDRYQMTDLVRLVPEVDQNRENSIPYWEGKINIHPKTCRSTIEIGEREIHYVFTDRWDNDQGIEPNRLCALICAVRETPATEKKIIGVHCRAGVGRTGTYIAAYVLAQDIDRQIANGISIDDLVINIDRTVWQLSLQRPFAVTHFSQYLTLYRFVNDYLKIKLCSNKKKRR